MRSRLLLLAFLGLGAAAPIEAREGPPASALSSPTLSSSATCASGQVTVQWTSYEKGASVLPQWIGYDVLRRVADSCEPFVRLNAAPFPRTPGVQHGHSLVDTPPSLETTYEYRVVRVDAVREQVPCTVNEGYCFGSSQSDWVSCPDQSAPALRGTLADWGWTLYLSPCPGSCYPGVYLGSDDDGTLIEQLRPYVGRTVALYGDVFCGTVEGCGMSVTGFEPGPCNDIVPVKTRTWAGLKVLYR